MRIFAPEEIWRLAQANKSLIQLYTSAEIMKKVAEIQDFWSSLVRYLQGD